MKNALPPGKYTAQVVAVAADDIAARCTFKIISGEHAGEEVEHTVHAPTAPAIPQVFATRPHDPVACLLTKDEFFEAVEDGMLDDDDGFGELANATMQTSMTINPSEAGDVWLWPAWATHVAWYNR